MNIANLLVALGVESGQLLSGGSVDGLFEIRAQSRPSAASLLGDTIAGVDTLGAVGGLYLAVEALEGGREAIRDAMLVIEGNGALDGIVADGVAVSEILGDDASARLVLLRDVILVAGCIICS